MQTNTEHRPTHSKADEPGPALPAGCPMTHLLEMLTRPWTLHILWVLSRQGPMRFGSLRRAVEGISPRLLTVRLRTLEREGLIRRTPVPGKVPEVIYSPTARMNDLQGVMQKLHDASERWAADEIARPKSS